MTTATRAAARAARPVLLLLLLSLAGCFGLNRGAPAPRHYVLGADGAGDATARPVAGGAEPGTIGLRPLRLAEYLASPLIPDTSNRPNHPFPSSFQHPDNHPRSAGRRE